MSAHNGHGTLALVTPGEWVRVETIVFGALRALCGDLGLREGEDVQCRAGTSGTMILQTENGRLVCLARDWARYIRVAAPAAHPPAIS